MIFLLIALVFFHIDDNHFLYFLLFVFFLLVTLKRVPSGRKALLTDKTLIFHRAPNKWFIGSFVGLPLSVYKFFSLLNLRHVALTSRLVDENGIGEFKILRILQVALHQHFIGLDLEVRALALVQRSLEGNLIGIFLSRLNLDWSSQNFRFVFLLRSDRLALAGYISSLGGLVRLSGLNTGGIFCVGLDTFIFERM